MGWRKRQEERELILGLYETLCNLNSFYTWHPESDLWTKLIHLLKSNRDVVYFLLLLLFYNRQKKKIFNTLRLLTTLTTSGKPLQIHTIFKNAMCVCVYTHTCLYMYIYSRVYIYIYLLSFNVDRAVIINRHNRLVSFYTKARWIYFLTKLEYSKEMRILNFLNYVCETELIYIVSGIWNF